MTDEKAGDAPENTCDSAITQATESNDSTKTPTLSTQPRLSLIGGQWMNEIYESAPPSSARPSLDNYDEESNEREGKQDETLFSEVTDLAELAEATELLAQVRSLWIQDIEDPTTATTATTETPAQDNEKKLKARMSSGLTLLAQKRVYKTLSDYIMALRLKLLDNREQEEQEEVCAFLLNKTLLGDLIRQLHNMTFQAMRDVGLLFKELFRRKRPETIDYLTNRPHLIGFLIENYQDEAATHSYGTILRQCVRVEELCRAVLWHPSFYLFFNYVQDENFEVASDSFATFTLALVKQKKLAVEFMLEHFDTFMVEEWNKLLMTRTYVTKRQSIKIIRDLLTARSNFKVMIRYVNEVECCKVIAELLSGRKNAIRADAYHVMKIFILNPRKSPEIVKFLVERRKKIMKGLEKLTPTTEIDKVMDLLAALKLPSES